MNRRLLSLIAAAFALLQATTPARAAPVVGQPAPALQATLLDGTRFDLAAHRGEVVLLNFWASWCEPCRAEMPAFERYYAMHRGEGFTVLAVSMDEPDLRARVEQIARGFSFPIAAVTDTQAAGYGRIWRLPISFVIDREGRLRVDGGRGERRSYDAATLAAELDPLLHPRD